MKNEKLISMVRKFSIFLDFAALAFSLYLAGYIMWGDAEPMAGVFLGYLIVFYWPVWLMHAAIYGVLHYKKKRIRTRTLLLVSLVFWWPLIGNLHDPIASLFKSLGISS